MPDLTYRLTANLPLHSGPSIASPVIGGVAVDSQVQVLDIGGLDVWIELDVNGQRGWAHVICPRGCYVERCNAV